MTSKEKAKELVDKMMYKIMYNCQPTLSKMVAKQCALIAVDELIKQESKTDDYYEIGSYWEEVKQEINKL